MNIQISSLVILVTLFVDNAAAQELISDIHFQNGLIIKAPDMPVTIDGTIQFDITKTAIWTCGQWNSKSSLADIISTLQANGWYHWKDQFKEVQMGPYGAEDYDVLLGVNSQNEWNDVYRQAGEPWPHLLVEQRISDPNAYGPGCPSLDRVEKLQFHVEAKLGNDSTIIRDGYNANIHAAQFVIYFTVQNLNPNSSGYGSDYIWLGIHVYDDRDANPAEYINHDDGTQTLIYSIAYDSVVTKSTHTNEWVNFDVDLYPYALKALDEAWNRGYLSASQDLADYKFGGMNMGWEVPGLSIVDMKIRNISLVAETELSTGQWDFDNDLEGWTAGINISDIQWGTGGYLNADMTGDDPQLLAPGGLNIDITDKKVIYIRMKNSSIATRAKVYFATAAEPSLSESKSKSTPITANDTNFTEYKFDMSDNALWTGTLTKLRFDPAEKNLSDPSGAGGSLSIDYINISSATTGIEEPQIVKRFQLQQNYPNPFNSSTEIKYTIPESGAVVLKVYNVVGNEVALLVNKNQIPGNYSVKFNASALLPGIYFYKLTTGEYSAYKKCLLINP